VDPAQIYGWLSILPPVIAIGMALRTRQVYVSLFVGILFGTTVLAGWNPLAGATGVVETLIQVITQRGNAEPLLFTLVVGALIVLMRESGGVNGFASWMVNRGWVRGQASAQLISILIGISIFIESNITCLVTGTVSRPLYDRVKLSRAKLAYMCDSTSAPICVLIPLNGWGAYVLALLAAEGLENPLRIMAWAVPLNFYALTALALVFAVALTGWNIGPMKESEDRALAGDTGALAEEPSVVERGNPSPGAPDAAGGLDPTRAPDVLDDLEASGEPDVPDAGDDPGGDGDRDIPERARNLVIPVGVMLLVMPLGLYVTGEGDFLAGSGTLSVLWATCAGVLAAMFLYRIQGIFGFNELAELSIQGFRELTGVATILALALTLGQVCRDLGTGPWVADTVSPFINDVTVAPLLFLTGALIAFSTGTSWGTWALLFPIAVPVATTMGASLPLTTGAVMGGGIFGDHCSPISDTTVISSLSAGVDHIEHVVTQMPYALLGGATATGLYLVAGLLLT